MLSYKCNSTLFLCSCSKFYYSRVSGMMSEIPLLDYPAIDVFHPYILIIFGEPD